MQPHQERVVTEKQELDAKISKLEAFVTGSIFAALQADEQDRLTRQLTLMTQYPAVLQERISNFR
jgi:hypothetical protein